MSGSTTGRSGSGRIVRGYIVPGMPHVLLAPEKSAGWSSLRASFGRLRQEIEESGADLLLLYSTQWISVIGHQIQADPKPKWVHVDPEWHALGSMPYEFRMDPEFGKACEGAARARGLHARTVAYHGFPIDTGTVVALKLLDPENRLQASVVSCNMYADRAETLVLGKAARDAVIATGRRAIAVAVTALSNRMFTSPIDPANDRISSLKDDEWNRKILEILGEGRLEDVSQLAREFSSQANGDQKMKAIWWLASLMGEHNDYDGRVFDYQPVWGTGAALVGLTASTKPAARLEFDEEGVESYSGDRGVLATTTGPDASPSAPAGNSSNERASADPSGRVAREKAGATISSSGAIRTDAAPGPVGAYPHARRVGDFLYLSGIGPRQAGTNEIPGGPVRDSAGARCDYDIEAQTRATIENIRTILESAGSSLDRVFDVSVFLIDMARDFAAFNRVYAEYFEHVGATRTTVEVRALPTPIAVELKVVAFAA